MIKFLEGWQNIAAMVGIASIGVILAAAAAVVITIGVGNLIVKQLEGVEE